MVAGERVVAGDDAAAAAEDAGTVACLAQYVQIYQGASRIGYHFADLSISSIHSIFRLLESTSLAAAVHS